MEIDEKTKVRAMNSQMCCVTRWNRSLIESLSLNNVMYEWEMTKNMPQLPSTIPLQNEPYPLNSTSPYLLPAILFALRISGLMPMVSEMKKNMKGVAYRQAGQGYSPLLG